MAFEASMVLLRGRGKQPFLEDMYHRLKEELRKSKEEQVNLVKELYGTFSTSEISDKIAQMIRPSNLNAGFELIFQTIEGLHAACPDHRGDWYFTGNYPTPGGNKVSNQAFLNYMEGSDRRAY